MKYLDLLVKFSLNKQRQSASQIASYVESLQETSKSEFYKITNTSGFNLWTPDTVLPKSINCILICVDIHSKYDLEMLDISNNHTNLKMKNCIYVACYDDLHTSAKLQDYANFLNDFNYPPFYIRWKNFVVAEAYSGYISRQNFLNEILSW